MNTLYQKCRTELKSAPRHWLITGVAGFIGSHLAKELLSLGQEVIGVDNFFTGSMDNIHAVKDAVSVGDWGRFKFVEGDILDASLMGSVCKRSQIVLHHAAISSVQFSLENPAKTFAVNAGGFLQVLESARATECERVVFASSAAVYGNHPLERKDEDLPLRPESLYGLTKEMNEKTATHFRRIGLEVVGLRYFNVYGPGQASGSPYSGVIARFANALKTNKEIVAYGDGKSTRDFVHVSDVVQANLLAAVAPARAVTRGIYNVGTGYQTSIVDLYSTLSASYGASSSELVFGPSRDCDIRYSCANISNIENDLGYRPTVLLADGVKSLICSSEKGSSAHRKSILSVV